MSPVRRHFWQVAARVKSSFTLPRKWSLNWFIPAGVKSTEGSSRGTSKSLGRRVQPLDSKNARYFSRSSSVFMEAYAAQEQKGPPLETKDSGRTILVQQAKRPMIVVSARGD